MRVLAYAMWEEVWEHEQATGTDLQMKHWGSGGGSFVFRFFDNVDDAAHFRLSLPVNVKLQDIDDCWFEHIFEDAHYEQYHDRRYRDSNVRLPTDYLEDLLVKMSPNKWQSEAGILELGGKPLTPFQWKALTRSPYFRVADRKQGDAFRLSAEGERMRAEAIRQRKHEQWLREQEAQRERQKREHEALMAKVNRSIEEHRAKLSPEDRAFVERMKPGVIYLRDRSAAA